MIMIIISFTYCALLNNGFLVVRFGLVWFSTALFQLFGLGVFLCSFHNKLRI